MKGFNLGFLHLLPNNKNNMTYEKFRTRINTILKNGCFKEPTEEMEVFFRNMYELDDKTYKDVKSKFRIKYSFLKEYCGTINKIMSIESEEPLEYLMFFNDLYKSKNSIMMRELENVLVVDKTSDEYKKYENNDFDDEALAKVIRAVANARRIFMELFGFLSDDVMFGEVYQRFLDSMSQDVLTEIKRRVNECVTSKARLKENIKTSFVEDAAYQNIKKRNV